MATTKEVYERYLNYNLFHIGKGSGTQSSHHWHESIYYYNGLPVQRIFQRKGQRPVVVCIGGMFPKNMRKDFDEIFVEDIGVFSKYLGDMVDGQAAHDRQRYMMLSRIQTYVDVVIPGMSDEQCHNVRTLPGIEKDLNGMYEKYRDYSILFFLDWPSLPRSYIERAVSQVIAKAERWSDPKAITKRERAAAKRMANKALGLD